MRHKPWIIYFLLALFRVSRNGVAAQSAYVTDAKALHTAMTWQYNPDVRPDSSVAVSVAFAISTINDLDISTEKFSVTGWFSLSWTDSSFGWTPSSPSNIEYIFLKNDNCWRPQIVINNAVGDLQFLGDDEQQMRVKSDGTVFWEPGGVFTVKCSVDGTDFPFDEQSCSLSISSSVNDDTEVVLSQNFENVTLNDFQNNAEWTLTDTSTEKSIIMDASKSFSKSLLRFTFKLERNSSFYVWALLVPYILVSCLGLVTFILPSMCGEKISLSTTVILLVVVYFIIFSTLTTKPTGKFPTIGVYFFMLLIINILELLVTVIVERMHRNEIEERPVSDNVQKIANTFLSRLSCYRGAETNTDMGYSDKQKTTIRFGMPKNTRVSPASLQLAHPPSGRPRKPDIEFDRIKSAASTRTTSDVTVSTDVSNASSTLPLQLRVEEYSWKDIANMVDRIFLLMFLFLVVTATIVFIAVLHSSV